MIVICEKCGSEYEVGDIEEGKILRCHKCGDTWKHLINKKKNFSDEANVQNGILEFAQNPKEDNECDAPTDLDEKNQDDEEKKSSNFLMYVLFIIAITLIYLMYKNEITILFQNALEHYDIDFFNFNN